MGGGGALSCLTGSIEVRDVDTGPVHDWQRRQASLKAPIPDFLISFTRRPLNCLKAKRAKRDNSHKPSTQTVNINILPNNSQPSTSFNQI